MNKNNGLRRVEIMCVQRNVPLLCKEGWGRPKREQGGTNYRKIAQPRSGKRYIGKAGINSQETNKDLNIHTEEHQHNILTLQLKCSIVGLFSLEVL